MEKKAIQEKRMREYFIQATKEILKGEGLRCATVRNIADRAGYSYATLYNYFTDLKDLIFVCVNDFQQECMDFVLNDTKHARRGVTKLKSMIKSYIKFFVQYTGIFELLYLEKMTDISKRQSEVEIICSLLDRICADAWQYCFNENVYTTAETNVKRDQVRYAVMGLLLYYINLRTPESYTQFIKAIDQQLANILD